MVKGECFAVPYYLDCRLELGRRTRAGHKSKLVAGVQMLVIGLLFFKLSVGKGGL